MNIIDPDEIIAAEHLAKMRAVASLALAPELVDPVLAALAVADMADNPEDLTNLNLATGLILTMIGEDRDEDRIPVWLNTFEDLHGRLDANEYGLQAAERLGCWPITDICSRDHEGSNADPASFEFINAVTDAVDAALKDGWLQRWPSSGPTVRVSLVLDIHGCKVDDEAIGTALEGALDAALRDQIAFRYFDTVHCDVLSRTAPADAS
jgi:hypothetical protein